MKQRQGRLQNKKRKTKNTHTHTYIYICIYDCFPPGWHQNLQDNINFLRIAKQSSGCSHDTTKKACVFMYESSFCLHPPRLDEICVYLEVTWSQRFAKAEESKSRAFFTKHVENTLVYKMIEKKDPIFLIPQQALFSSAGHRSMKEVHACTLRLWRSNKKSKDMTIIYQVTIILLFWYYKFNNHGPHRLYTRYCRMGGTLLWTRLKSHFKAEPITITSEQLSFFQPYCFLCM